MASGQPAPIAPIAPPSAAGQPTVQERGDPLVGSTAVNRIVADANNQLTAVWAALDAALARIAALERFAK